jgi:hypothetical protein
MRYAKRSYCGRRSVRTGSSRSCVRKKVYFTDPIYTQLAPGIGLDLDDPQLQAVPTALLAWLVDV